MRLGLSVSLDAHYPGAGRDLTRLLAFSGNDFLTFSDGSLLEFAA